MKKPAAAVAASKKRPAAAITTSAAAENDEEEDGTRNICKTRAFNNLWEKLPDEIKQMAEDIKRQKGRPCEDDCTS